MVPLLQCVALDPQADRVAAGDTTGRINIWHQLRSMHKEVDRWVPKPR